MEREENSSIGMRPRAQQELGSPARSAGASTPQLSALLPSPHDHIMSQRGQEVAKVQSPDSERSLPHPP